MNYDQDRSKGESSPNSRRQGVKESCERFGEQLELTARDMYFEVKFWGYLSVVGDH